MRGDPPPEGPLERHRGMSTPHARGSTRTVIAIYSSSQVYPACAGIHPHQKAAPAFCSCLPRMRGDPPAIRPAAPIYSGSTPHARGSTFNYCIVKTLCFVYPACAGIHLLERASEATGRGLPRMRGDPPGSSSSSEELSPSTPHARGSTLGGRPAYPLRPVYPACAGIHLARIAISRATYRLPRMRGDRLSKVNGGTEYSTEYRTGEPAAEP